MRENLTILQYTRKQANVYPSNTRGDGPLA